MLSLVAVAISVAVFAGRTTACWPPPPTAGSATPEGGELAITEVMIEPQPGRPEWFEVRNESITALDLSGCTFSDGGAAGHEVFLPPGIVLPSGGLLVVAETELTGDAGVVSDVEVGEDELVLSEIDPVEVLSVHCPGADGLTLVDQVPIGELDEGARGHSWMFDGEGWTAMDNDDPRAWCLASSHQVFASNEGNEEYGTPGDENRCGGAGGPAPLPGELRVTELMVAPAVGREWFEVRSEVDGELDLSGCIVAEEGVGLVHEHTITGERGTTVLPPGGFLLFAASGTDLFGEDSVEADYEYSTLTFNNSDPEELSIRCQGTEIERVAYDWSALDGERGQTLSRDPDVQQRWCLGQDAIDVGGEIVAWGTPGSDNPPCADGGTAPPTYPLPGEIVITELMVAPSSGTVFPEWFEIVNVGARTVEIDGCVVEDDGHAATLVAGSDLAPGQVAVVASGSFDPSCDIAVWAQYGGSVTFNNSSPDRAALTCPDKTGGWSPIDEVAFEWETWDLDKGTSLVLDADAVDAVDNDLAANWCAAPPGVWSCEVDGHRDQGTPGTLVFCDS